MNEVTINTDKMRSCGEDMIKLVEELKLTFNEMFIRFGNVPEKTREWVGESAEKFVADVCKDKTEYMNFVNGLYKYGKYLIDSANEYDNLIRGMKE